MKILVLYAIVRVWRVSCVYHSFSHVWVSIVFHGLFTCMICEMYSNKILFRELQFFICWESFFSYDFEIERKHKDES